METSERRDRVKEPLDQELDAFPDSGAAVY